MNFPLPSFQFYILDPSWKHLHSNNICPLSDYTYINFLSCFLKSLLSLAVFFKRMLEINHVQWIGMGHILMSVSYKHLCEGCP